MAARKKKNALKSRYKSGGGASAGGKVQTLLFPRDWSEDDARLWASLHGFKTDDIDTTDSHVRIHQTRREGKAVRVRTIPWATGGVRAVVEFR